MPEQPTRVIDYQGVPEAIVPGAIFVPPPAKATSGMRLVTSTGRIFVSDRIVKVDLAGGAVNLALPNAREMVGQRLTVIRIANTTNALTVTPLPGQTVNGATTGLTVGTTLFDARSFISDGIEWYSAAGV